MPNPTSSCAIGCPRIDEPRVSVDDRTGGQANGLQA
jgi:hypothetical protein